MTIENLKNDLQKTILEMGNVSVSGILTNAWKRFEEQDLKGVVEVDLYLCSKLTDQYTTISKAMESQAGFSYNVIDTNHLCLKILGNSVAPLAVWLTCPNAENDHILLEYYTNRKNHYLYNLIVETDNEVQIPAQIEKNIVEIIKTANVLDFNLENWLQENREEDFRSLLKKKATWNAIHVFTQYLGDTFQKENELIQARKNFHQQTSMQIRKREQGTQQNETSGQLKNLIQASLLEFEKQLKTKYEEKNKPNIGAYTAVIQKSSDTIKDLKRESIAEKTEKYAATISTEDLNKILGYVQHELTADFKLDISHLNGQLDELNKEIHLLLNSRSAKASSGFEPKLPEFPKIDRVLHSYVAFGKNYQGEVVKKGIMEYFVALRDYTGVIMVVGGILAPFTIIANGADSPFFKQMGLGLRITVALITIAMVVYGFVDLRKRIPRKRQEELAKELGRAKEVVATETKRMFSESTRDWTTQLTNWLREANTKMISEVEQHLKQIQLNAQSQVTDDKQKYERHKQSIENRQKRLSNAERMYQDFTRTLKEKMPTIK